MAEISNVDNAYQTGIVEGMRREREYAAQPPVPEPPGNTGLLSDEALAILRRNHARQLRFGDVYVWGKEVAAAQWAVCQEQLAAAAQGTADLVAAGRGLVTIAQGELGLCEVNGHPSEHVREALDAWDKALAALPPVAGAEDEFCNLCKGDGGAESGGPQGWIPCGDCNGTGKVPASGRQGAE